MAVVVPPATRWGPGGQVCACRPLTASPSWVCSAAAEAPSARQAGSTHRNEDTRCRLCRAVGVGGPGDRGKPCPPPQPYPLRAQPWSALAVSPTPGRPPGRRGTTHLGPVSQRGAQAPGWPLAPHSPQGGGHLDQQGWGESEPGLVTPGLMISK